MKKIICFVYNTSQYLYKFRLMLMLDLINQGFHVVALAPEDRYSNNIIDAGIDYYPIKITNKYNPIADLSIVFHLYRLYKKLGPVIIHHYTIKPVLYGTLAGRLAGIPCIINSITGLGYSFSSASIKRFLICTFYYITHKSKNVHVIFQNPDDKIFFLERNLINATQANLIVSSGIDLNFFNYKSHLNIRNSKNCTFLFLSRLLYEKGIKELVFAIEELYRRNNKVRLIIAGEVEKNNPRSVNMGWLEEKDKSPAISWVGYVDDVLDLLLNVDVMVLPSYYREGVPHSLIEALSVGLPIITTDMPGCRMVVKNQYNGFMIPPRDVGELLNAMELLSKDRELRKKMGNKSLKIAKYFDIKKINNQTIALYMGLMDN